MNTFIRIIEVWRPSDDGSLLELGGGLFGTATRFASISRDMCFGRAEGLPGQAWEEGRPIMLTQFEGSNFQRIAAAKAAGLSCALALPIFVADQLKAVVVFFCSDDTAQAGALELWHNDPRVTSDLSLVDGHYGRNGQELEALSREAFLPRGSGLPGMAWQRGTAVFMDDVAQSTHFLRAQTATAAGIDRGLAIPCETRSNEACVAVFLSASATPIAKRIERWVPDATGQNLQRADGFCEGTGPLTAPGPVIGLAAGGGSIAETFKTGMPAMVKAVVSEPEAVGAVAAAAGLSSLAVIPVVADGAVVEVVALYF